MYQVHRHKTEPRRFFIYEQYKDDASLESHRTTPHFLQYARKELTKVRTGWKATSSNRWDSLVAARALWPASAGRKPVHLTLSIINSPPEA